MIQPSLVETVQDELHNDHTPVCQVGCIGRITALAIQYFEAPTEVQFVLDPRLALPKKPVTASTPASAARPQVTNQGDICGASTVPVAKRVMGKVSPKMNTPRSPSQRPRFSPC